MSASIKPYGTYAATVCIRRGEGWEVKPECEAIDGHRAVFKAGWREQKQ